MKLNLQKYLEVSTIHGLAYTMKRFHLVERIFWIIALIFSVFCTSVLIIQLAIRMQNVPIVVYVLDGAVPNSEINFPAVTVCPLFLAYIGSFFPNHKMHYYEKHNMKKLFLEWEEFWKEEFSEEVKLRNLTFDSRFKTSAKDVFQDFSYLDVMEQLRNGNLKPEQLGPRLLKRLQVIDIITKRGTFSKLNFSIPTHDFLDVINQFDKQLYGFSQILWTMEPYPFITEVLTQHGLCLTFNMANSQDLLNINATSEDFHYQLHSFNLYLAPDIVEPPDLPRRDLSSFPSDFYILFSREPSNYKDIIYNNFHGLFFMIHDPYELPSIASSELKILSGEFPNVDIIPQKISIDDSIAAYEPKDRNCYLEDERKLRFFKVYTKINCETECLSDFTLARCGCVEFFMIRNSTTRICSASEKSCYDSSQADFLEMKSSCGCLERCNYVKYDFEKVSKGFRRDQTTALHFSVTFAFKDSTLTELVRKVQFDLLEFLSFIGGLLGLFAGISALSIVELIYWFTIRALITLFGRLSGRVEPSEGEASTVDGPKWRLLAPFFNESSVHGLKFIFNFTRLDSIIWAVLNLLSISFCFDLIMNAGQKLPDSRTTANDDSLTFDGEVPFPAITITPGLYVWSAFYQYPLIDDEHKFIRLKMLKRNKTLLTEYIHNFTKLAYCQESLNYRGYKRDFISFERDHFNFLKETSQADWFRKQFSSFNGRFQPEFSEIRTSNGMAFTFNLMDANDLVDFRHMSPMFNYTENLTTKQQSNLHKNSLHFPLKFTPHDRPHLKLKLLRESLDTQCVDPAILIHDSDSLPTFMGRYDFIGFDYGMKVNIEITPEILRTDDSLRSLSPEARECYFEGEKKLKFFKKYSLRNCEVECFANQTFKECGCYDLNQPFESEDQICKNIRRYDEFYCPVGLVAELKGSTLFSLEKNCSCLPMCNSVTYKTKFLSEFKAGSEIFNELTLNVRMNMDEIVLFRRYQQFTRSDVVSYVGGLLGLFAGISMLSIVEFVYFFTIRLVVDMWRLMRRGGRRH